MAANGDNPATVPRPESPVGSSRTASTSLQAAAAMNAGLQHEPSRRSSSSSLTRNRSSPNAGRRRSAVLMNLQLNDPSVPAPGEMQSEQTAPQRGSPLPLSGSPLMADPNHHRAPSLGELHQELEAEQEAHVNRLLQMIRQQQLELQRLQANQPQQSQNASADDTSAIVSDRPGPSTASHHHGSQSSIPPALPTGGSYPRSPVFHHARSSFDMARADLQRRSRTPSRGASPRVRSGSISAESGDWVLGGRDESAFYQAETQMLTRENQMLRHRVRDLEKQLGELSTNPPVGTEPVVASNLTRSSTNAEDGSKTPSEAPKES